MGTLRELLDYIHKTAGVQKLLLCYNQAMIECDSNDRRLSVFDEKKVVELHWVFRKNKITIVIRDELT